MQASQPPDPSVEPIRPMLAAEGAMPAGSAWAFEFYWDGLRAIAYLTPDRIRLLSGSDRSITAGYPDLGPLAELVEQRGPLVLDGKIVALDQLERPSTALLRQRTAASKPSAALLARVPVSFYLTDLLYADGRTTLDLPFRQRRELLEGLNLDGLPARLPPFFVDTDGQTVLHAAQLHGLSGVLAKRLDSRYQPGRRTRAWVQTLPRQNQEVVIGGWVPKNDSVTELGALLVGVPGSGGLRYAGRVAAGLDRWARAELAERLAALGNAECPFTDPPRETDRARWVRPALVGEVSYRRRGIDGRLRNASWLGLRADAHPASVRASWVLGETTPGETRSGAGDLEALDEAVQLAQSEIRSLRAQISQHFLYNALTTIAAFVRTDPNRARELLHEFAAYTRYSFRAGGEATTLGAELANVDRYLALEAARFGDRLRVERQIDERLHDVPLPFLAVQQLVENAVRHGIEGTPRGGTVRLTAEPGPTGCVLTVSDDGPGMDPERLTDAVTDVRERLAAAPGPPAALEVHTAPEHGTTITLRLPR